MLKLGRTFTKVRQAFEDAGRLGDAWYVERAATDRQRVVPPSVDPADVPYMSLALLTSPAERSFEAPPGAAGGPRMGAGRRARAGRAAVAHPEAQDVLASATDLVGYGPYLDRVAPNPRQRRHASGNRVEADRARHALALARDGARVAVVSSGDPGVFAMAAAVLEAAAEDEFADVPVQVVPGLTAAQAVAARAGAPLGHDFCVLSLSDILAVDVIARRPAAAAEADLVLALYNPSSSRRKHQLPAARDLLLEHRSPRRRW